MFLGIAILGVIFIIITSFSIVNAHRRQEPKRGPIIVLVITTLVTVGALTQLPYWSQSNSQATSESAKKASISSQSGQAFSTSSTTANTRADNEKQVEKQLTKSLKKLGTVSFDHDTKTYTLTITNASLKKTIKALKADPSQAKTAKWPRFANNFTKTSQSLKKALGKGYTLVLRVGTQSPVLVYKDGYLTKNQFE
ncbi:toprim domain-containing protein [Levilactobacillus cerevisiae]|uniref:DUF3854 domain-containing protein n=1 Tax=Levilactobacillus cerevisiae TaxID=1704076 RepID=UPI000F7A6062|nr:DUF3854 domain-containing protein [Levilactobacillus cerevisiae]